MINSTQSRSASLAGIALTGLALVVTAGLSSPSAHALAATDHFPEFAQMTSSGDAIVGTGKTRQPSANVNATSSGDAIVGTGKSRDVAGSTGSLILLGGIDHVDTKRGTIEALGRTFQIPAAHHALLIANEAMASGQQMQVAVTGELTATGRLAQGRVSLLTDHYVPGVSPVVITGRITSVDVETGQFSLGSVVVDYSPLLAIEQGTPEVGALVVVVGTRPGQSLYVLASQIKSATAQVRK